MSVTIRHGTRGLDVHAERRVACRRDHRHVLRVRDVEVQRRRGGARSERGLAARRVDYAQRGRSVAGVLRQEDAQAGARDQMNQRRRLMRGRPARGALPFVVGEHARQAVTSVRMRQVHAPAREGRGRKRQVWRPVRLALDRAETLIHATWSRNAGGGMRFVVPCGPRTCQGCSLAGLSQLHARVKVSRWRSSACR